MSYCRNDGKDSDVYVIMTRDPEAEQNILLCYCSQDFFTTTRTEMIAHLQTHLQKGEKVPVRAFERLQREIEEEGDPC